MSFFRNVVQLGSATAGAQVVSILAVPIITRLYSPTDYAVFALFVALTSSLLPAANLRLNAAMMLPESDEEAVNILGLNLVAAVLISAALTIGLIAARHAGILPEVWRVKDSILLDAAVGTALLVQAFSQAFTFWSFRRRRFDRAATARILESVVDRGSVIAIGAAFSASALGIVFGRILGPFVGLVSQLVPRSDRPSIAELRPRRMWDMAVRYRRFPLVASWSIALDAVSRQAPVLLLPLFFVPAVTGYYGLVVQVLNLPMLMVGDALSSVFLQSAARLRDDPRTLTRDSLRLFAWGLYLSVPPIALVMALGPDLFHWAFGAEWTAAGDYARILAPTFVLTFLHRPVSTLFDVFERQGPRLAFDVLLFGLRAVGVVAGAYLLPHDPRGAIYGLLIAGVVGLGAGLHYLFGLLGIGGKAMGLFLAKRLLVLAPSLVGTALAVSWDPAIPTKIAIITASLGVQTLAFAFAERALVRRGIARLRGMTETGLA